jgi:hypothetical protein
MSKPQECYLFGCDPELKISGIKACDIVGDVKNAAFGVDGWPEQFELRPHCAKEPFDLMANTAKVLRSGWEQVPFFHDANYPMLAGHYKDKRPLGGHLHISGLKNIDIYTLSDSLMGPMVLLSDCLDNLEERARREAHRNGMYGRRTPIRTGPTHQHPAGYLEWRVPGSWLLSPAVTFANMWLFGALGRLFDQAPLDVEKSQTATLVGQFVKEDHSETNPFDMSMKIAQLLAPLFPDGDLYVDTLDALFSKCPLDWKQNIWENWI